jgi:uncharacterized protein (DUF2249 family)
VNPEPITLDWKIHKVLKRYPALLEVLVAASPKFSHLRNPLMRKVQARLVDVGQAARVAGLEPADLLGRLNAALGISGPSCAPPENETRASLAAQGVAWDDEAPAVMLDVRPSIARGEEPFSVILSAVGGLGPGEVLQLRAPFEPVPLYEVLGGRGFEHATRRNADDDWEVRFRKARGPAASERPTPAAPPDWNERPSLVIDVSDLEPPGPMIRILEALEEMPGNAMLLVEHVRRPIHLYDRLDERGCTHETRELAPNRVQVLIRKP